MRENQIAEHRLLAYESALHEWRSRAADDYLGDPLKNVAGVTSILLEGPDLLIDKAARTIDGTTKEVPPLVGHMARTRRSLGIVFGSGTGIATRITTGLGIIGAAGQDVIEEFTGVDHVSRTAA